MHYVRIIFNLIRYLDNFIQKSTVMMSQFVWFGLLGLDVLAGRVDFGDVHFLQNTPTLLHFRHRLITPVGVCVWGGREEELVIYSTLTLYQPMTHICVTSSHKPIRIYMEGLILGVNTLYRLFCFFTLVSKGLSLFTGVIM